MKSHFIFIGLFGFIFSTSLWADLSIPVYFSGEKNSGKLAGMISVQETKYGLLFTPSLKGLPAGIHGFHIHEHPTCEKHAMSAGGHFDPQHTNQHLGPYNDQGHLGDLPALYADAEGNVSLPVLAPRLRQINQISDHTLMIHAGGENYSDVPQKLGGGGDRLLCGVIPKS